MLLRVMLLSLPLLVMVFLGWRSAAAGGQARRIKPGLLYQFVLDGVRAPAAGADASSPALALRGWPERSPGALSVFVEEGIPRPEVERALRRRGIPFTLVSDAKAADLGLRRAPPGGSVTTIAAAEVLEGGRVRLQLPASTPAAVSAALADNVWGSVDPLDGEALAIGLLRRYKRPRAQADREARDRGRGRSKPAPERRWVSIPQLVSDAPQARLVPAIQTVRPGELCQVDFQVLGYDGEWYSITNRTETRFRVAPATESLTLSGLRKGEFLAPVDARLRSAHERVVVEAALDGPGGLGLSAEAVVIVDPGAGW
jgi:hypothetical protein